MLAIYCCHRLVVSLSTISNIRFPHKWYLRRLVSFRWFWCISSYWKSLFSRKYWTYNIYMFLGLSNYRRIKRWAEEEHSIAQSPVWFKMVPLIKVDSLPTKKKGQSDTIYVYMFTHTVYNMSSNII